MDRAQMLSPVSRGDVVKAHILVSLELRKRGMDTPDRKGPLAKFSRQLFKQDGKFRLEAGIHLHNLERENGRTKVDGAHKHLFILPDGTILWTEEDGVHEHKMSPLADLITPENGEHIHKVILPDGTELLTQPGGLHNHQLQMATTVFDGIHEHVLRLADGSVVDTFSPAELWEHAGRPPQEGVDPAAPASVLAKQALTNAPKGIQFVGGRLPDETTLTVQTVIFDTAKWDEGRARRWLNDNGMKSGKLDKPESGNTLRFRQRPPEDFQDGSLKTFAPGAKQMRMAKYYQDGFPATLRKDHGDDEDELKAESAEIRQRKMLPAASQPHKFKEAKFTHPNGHPRCLVCGDEQTTSGVCNLDLAKEERIALRHDTLYMQAKMDAGLLGKHNLELAKDDQDRLQKIWDATLKQACDEVLMAKSLQIEVLSRHQDQDGYTYVGGVGPIPAEKAGEWSNELVKRADGMYALIGPTQKTWVDIAAGQVMEVEVGGLSYEASDNGVKLLKFDGPAHVIRGLTPNTAPDTLTEVLSLTGHTPVQKRYVVNLLKSQHEERFVLGIVLVPEEPDSQEDVYSALEVEKACHFWAEFGYMQIGDQHTDLVGQGQVSVLENYIARSAFTINGIRVKAGTWLLAVRIHDDELWEQVKTGEKTGYSIGGVSEAIEKVRKQMAA